MGGTFLALVVLLVAAGCGGGDTTTVIEQTQTTTTETTTSTATASGDNVVVALTGQDAAPDTSGEAIFSVEGHRAYLDLTASGLPAPSADEIHVVWFLTSEDEGYPLAPLETDGDSDFAHRFQIPTFALGIVSDATSVDVSLSAKGIMASAVKQAARSGTPKLGYSGSSILRGEVPP